MLNKYSFPSFQFGSAKKAGLLWGPSNSSVQTQENTARRKALNYSVTAGFLSILILEILSTQTTFCYYICYIPTFLHGAHSPHQPQPPHLPASHRYCENAWDSEGLGKSSTFLLHGNKSRVIHIGRRGSDEKVLSIFL